MIIAKTKLRKIPAKCSTCKFCVHTKELARKCIKENNYIGESYIIKRCLLTGIEVPYIFTKAKRNWEYTKCKSCPLSEV